LAIGPSALRAFFGEFLAESLADPVAGERFPLYGDFAPVTSSAED
jgi:hypothetical protein